MNFVEIRELHTPHLTMRKMRFEDVWDYYERIGSDGDVTRYMLFDPHQDISESLASIEKTLRRYEEGRCYRWAVALPEDDSLIGVIDLLRFNEEDNSCSFAYMLAADQWGKGYGTEILTEAIRFAFEELGVERITADHFAANAASGAVMRKAGMRHIGTIPEKYNKYGYLHDAECYEILRSQASPLTANDYQKQAMQTLNPALSKSDVLLNGVMGLCGESGEVIDLVKKHLHQGHELDQKKVAKELGDVAWYLAETAWALDIPLEDILRGNLDKLRRRYPQGFEAEKSIHRE